MEVKKTKMFGLKGIYSLHVTLVLCVSVSPLMRQERLFQKLCGDKLIRRLLTDMV